MIHKAKKLIEEDDDKTLEEKGIDIDSTIVIAIR
jgi:ABC-type sulfate transport system substrate-binding protein